MSFIYPRIVAVRRPNPMPGVGVQAYGGVTEANESVIAQGLPASIQEIRTRGRPEGETPSDAPARTGWNVFIPKVAAANGLITERDVIVDDLGKRYVVIAAYWDSLGFRLDAELLEA